MYNKKFIYLLIILLGSLQHVLGNDNNRIKLSSPDDHYVFNLEYGNSLFYSINWQKQSIIDKSAMGFQLKDGSIIPGKVIIERISEKSNNRVWNPVYGEQSVYRDIYNEILIQFHGEGLANIKMFVRIRAYNEGIAFRYEFDNDSDIEIVEELTEFSFERDPIVWVSSRAQSPIIKQKLSEVQFICERPLLAEISDTAYVALGEAGLVDFARMKFEKIHDTTNTLKANLDTGKPGSKKRRSEYGIHILSNQYYTPWRFIMAGRSPSDILQNNFLILNLNKENKILNTDWIKPGKIIREVTLTTAGGKACVDFAVKHNLQFVEFDAGWYGNEYDDTSDATTISVDPNRSPGPLDLHYIIDYARTQEIGIILYVNRRALEKQLDEVLPLYKSWGVAGLKYGFVQVGPQKWTDWLHEAVRKAASYELMVDIHDEYRPTGYSRTYPNLMTQEGIRGDEERTSNDMVINTLFTRMIAGAGDQTNCYFTERVRKDMGSHASQMAKAICIYSPWQFLYWYDRPVGSPRNKGGAGGAQGAIPEIADLNFFDEVPTVWDKSIILDGYPGELAVIARKNAEKWYLGVIAGTKDHLLSLKLDFLDNGKKYTAIIYSDEKSLNTLTNVQIQEIEVSSDSTFKQKVVRQNGLAVIFSPKDH